MSEPRQLLTKYVTEAAAVGDHTARGIAEVLLAEHSDIVEAWYREDRDLALIVWVSDVLRRTRQRELGRQVGGPRSGGGVSMSIFEVSVVVNDGSDRKPLGKCGAADLSYLSEMHGRLEVENGFYRQVYAQMATEVGTRLVEKVYKEDALRLLLGRG